MMSLQEKDSQVMLTGTKGWFALAIANVGALFVAGYIGFTIGKAHRVPELAAPKPVVIDQLNLSNPQAQEDTEASRFNINNPAKPVEDYADELSKIIKSSSSSQPADKKEAKAEQSPPLKKEDRSPPPKTDAKKLYTIQVTAISDYKKANAMVQTLKSKNFDAYLQTIATRNGTNIYRVRVGTVTGDEADALYAKLESIIPGLKPKKLEIAP